MTLFGYPDAPENCQGCHDYAPGKHCFVCLKSTVTEPSDVSLEESNKLTYPKPPMPEKQPITLGFNEEMYKWKMVVTDEDLKKIPVGLELFLLVEQSCIPTPEEAQMPAFVVRGFLERIWDNDARSNYGQQFQWWISDPECIDEENSELPIMFDHDWTVVAYRQVSSRFVGCPVGEPGPLGESGSLENKQ